VILLSFYSILGSKFAQAAREYGIKYLVQNNTVSYVAGSYDDIATTTASGTNQGGSCYFMPVSTRYGGEERQFIEMGLLKSQDMKAYFPSGLEINELADVVIDGGSWKVAPIPNGAISIYPNNANVVYTKVYLRSKRV